MRSGIFYNGIIKPVILGVVISRCYFPPDGCIVVFIEHSTQALSM